MRSPAPRPQVRVTRDLRGFSCSLCRASTTAAVRVGDEHAHIVLCRDCSRRIGAASERIASHDHDLEA